jgi:hypothetical protein
MRPGWCFFEVEISKNECLELSHGEKIKSIEFDDFTHISRSFHCKNRIRDAIL